MPQFSVILEEQKIGFVYRPREMLNSPQYLDLQRSLDIIDAKDIDDAWRVAQAKWLPLQTHQIVDIEEGVLTEPLKKGEIHIPGVINFKPGAPTSEPPPGFQMPLDTPVEAGHSNTTPTLPRNPQPPPPVTPAPRFQPRPPLPSGPGGTQSPLEVNPNSPRLHTDPFRRR
jgi:hypothetical protein